MSLKGKKIYHAKRAGVAILRLDKIEFKQKITWAPPQKKHFIMKEVSIHLEKITNIKIYAPNNRASKDLKQKLIEVKEKIYH